MFFLDATADNTSPEKVITKRGKIVTYLFKTYLKMNTAAARIELPC